MQEYDLTQNMCMNKVSLLKLDLFTLKIRSQCLETCQNILATLKKTKQSQICTLEVSVMWEKRSHKTYCYDLFGNPKSGTPVI